MSEYRIEPIGREHLSDVAELEKLCFAQPWSESALGLLLTDAATGFVCLLDGRAVAYGGMLLAPDEGQITNIAVHPDHRRLGLGARLMERLEGAARSRGLLQIALEVRASNEAAIALYERTGYAVAGRRPNFYTSPREDALVMIRALG